MDVVDRDRRDSRQGSVDLVEEDLQVAVAEAAAELDDGDALARAVELVAVEGRREFIALGEVGGRHPVGAAGAAEAHAALRQRAPVLRPGVEAEDAGDDPVELARDQDLALPAAIGAAGVAVHVHIGVKGVQQVAEAAGDDQRPARLVAVRDHQIVLGDEGLDRIEILGQRAMAIGQLGARQVAPLLDRLGVDILDGLLQRLGRAGGAHADGQAGHLQGVDRAGRPGVRQQGPLTAGQRRIATK